MLILETKNGIIIEEQELKWYSNCTHIIILAVQCLLKKHILPNKTEPILL